MPTNHRVESYQYEFRAVAEERIAILYLLGADDLLSMVVFTSDSEELPPPREALNGVVYVVYPYAWLDEVLEMLRLEKPVFFTWSADSQIARITTDEEPVGEEEHRSFLELLTG